jgi:hypothetical protein
MNLVGNSMSIGFAPMFAFLLIYEAQMIANQLKLLFFRRPCKRFLYLKGTLFHLIKLKYRQTVIFVKIIDFGCKSPKANSFFKRIFNIVCLVKNTI